MGVAPFPFSGYQRGRHFSINRVFVVFFFIQDSKGPIRLPQHHTTHFFRVTTDLCSLLTIYSFFVFYFKSVGLSTRLKSQVRISREYDQNTRKIYMKPHN